MVRVEAPNEDREADEAEAEYDAEDGLEVLGRVFKLDLLELEAKADQEDKVRLDHVSNHEVLVDPPDDLLEHLFDSHIALFEEGK